MRSAIESLNNWPKGWRQIIIEARLQVRWLRDTEIYPPKTLTANRTSDGFDPRIAWPANFQKPFSKCASHSPVRFTPIQPKLVRAWFSNRGTRQPQPGIVAFNQIEIKTRSTVADMPLSIMLRAETLQAAPQTQGSIRIITTT